MEEYCEVIKEVGSEYNIPVIDLHNQFGINEYNREALYWDELHPKDDTYIAMGEYITNSMYGNAVSKDKQLTTGINIINSGDFNINSSVKIFKNATMENGMVFDLGAKQWVSTLNSYKLLPNSEYYITFSCKSNSYNEVQFDFYNENTLVYTIVTVPPGENIVRSKLIIPTNVDITKKYAFRIASCSDKENIGISSLMLTKDTYHKWAQGSGEKEDRKWEQLALSETTRVSDIDPMYYKDAEGFIHFYGIVESK